MSIKSFAHIFACSIMFSVTCVVLPCCQKQDDTSATIVSKIRQSDDNKDSINSIRELNIAQSDKFAAIELAADSSLDFEAKAIAILLLPKESAQYIIDHPSRKLFDATCKSIQHIDGYESVNLFATSIDSIFKALPTSKQAIFLTRIAKPEECALYLEDTDANLAKEITKIYSESSDKSALNKFRQHLKEK